MTRIVVFYENDMEIYEGKDLHITQNTYENFIEIRIDEKKYLTRINLRHVKRISIEE